MALAQAIAPFLWSGNQAVTKEQLDRQRKLTDALRAPEGYTPRGIWSLAGGLAGEGAATYRDSQNDKTEAEKNKLVSDALARGDYETAMSSDFATPQQSAIASALMGRDWQAQDRETLWGREDAVRDEERAWEAANPDPQSLINTGDQTIYDPNTGEWIRPPPPAPLPEGSPLPPPDSDTVKGESSLRGEYNGINTVKDFGLQTSAYQRVLDSARDPSPAGDLALIFNYMKVLDPGSTVREGEFATAQNSGSVPEQIWAQYNKAMTGERLVPEIRKDFVTRAGELYQGAARLQQGTNQRYTDIASQYGYDPSRIVADVPKIGILDPEFNIDEYLAQAPDGSLTQTKPIPLTQENADAEYDALPSGAVFIGPDGQTRTKP